DVDARGVGDQDRRRVDPAPVDRHAALGDHALGIAPRGDTRARKALGDALAHAIRRLGHAHPAASMKAANILESPGSMANSGCHWTPRQNRLSGASIPSITPSGAVASTTAPGATAFTAW